MTHTLVTQLRFARSEFKRCLDGLEDEDARKRVGPPNSISWMIGHLANQEQSYWLFLAGGQVVARFVATRRNIVDLEKTLELVDSLGVREVHFHRFLPAGNGLAHFRELNVSPVDLYYGLRVLDLGVRRHDFKAVSVVPIQNCLIGTPSSRTWSSRSVR